MFQFRAFQHGGCFIVDILNLHCKIRDIPSFRIAEQQLISFNNANWIFIFVCSPFRRKLYAYEADDAYALMYVHECVVTTFYSRKWSTGFRRRCGGLVSDREEHVSGKMLIGLFERKGYTVHRSSWEVRDVRESWMYSFVLLVVGFSITHVQNFSIDTEKLIHTLKEKWE